jgi:hypothetical protein
MSTQAIQSQQGSLSQDMSAQTVPAQARERVRLVASVSRPQQVPSQDQQAAAAQEITRLEMAMRATRSLLALQTLLANDARTVGQAEQVMVFETTGKTRLRMVAASSVARPDRQAPAVQTFEALVREKLAHLSDLSSPMAPFLIRNGSDSAASHALLLPLHHRGHLLGATLHLRTLPWSEASQRLLHGMADTAAHAWHAHRPKRSLAGLPGSRLLLAGVGSLAVLCLALVPVPMTALAPVRVISTDPAIVSAPIDGVIDDILVKPNDTVGVGTPLLRFVPLQLSAKADMAERELGVAEARFKRVSMAALSSAEAKRDIAIVEAEYALKRIERDFAVEQLARSRIVSPRQGVALFGERRDWIGRPVATGERILEIANPAEVEFQLELPVEDAIAMHPGQTVSVFLDTAPLSPLAAEVTRINHEPRMVEGRGLAFLIYARILDNKTPPLGVRGTAHLRGEAVSLGLFLFRRPISAFRQWAGL